MRFLIALCLLLPAALPAQAGPVDLNYPDLLRAMVDLDWLWRPAPPGERAIQFASWDRGSAKGIGVQGESPWKGPLGWYANGDRGKYLRVEQRAGKHEYVMADVKGPGTVVRIWSANPSGVLHFYIDGASEPTWTVDFKALTHGRIPGLGEPYCGIRSKGCNCYLPIPFNRHLKVTSSKGDFYYHVNVRLFAPGTRVQSFDPSLFARHEDMLTATAKRLTKPWLFTAGDTEGIHGKLKVGPDPEDPANWPSVGIAIPPGTLVSALGIMVAPPANLEPYTYANLLRRILVCIEAGDKRTVCVPVADFFGSAPSFKPYNGYVMGVDEAGCGWCRLPMPFPRGGRIQLLADGPLPVTPVQITVNKEKRRFPPDTLAFRAAWHQRRDIRTRPFHDHRVLNARGRGRFVGCTLMVANPTRAWWGEGDEKFFVDGEGFPSTFGTGTEDYFGYAWCWPKLFASPYHAQTQCDGPNNFGYTCLNRFHVPDMVPFQSSFLFDLEVWHWQDVWMDYASTAYWYGPAGGHSGLPGMPPPERRRIEPIRMPKPYVAKGVLEGEDLKVLAVTAGKTERQKMGFYSSAEWKWSRERHLWWHGAKPGARLTLGLPVAEAGSYRVIVAFTRASDYGIVRLYLNGRRLDGKAHGRVDTIDLYHPRVSRRKPVEIDACRLAAGTSKLEVEIVGSNPKAAPKYMVGVDYVRLVKMAVPDPGK